MKILGIETSCDECSVALIEHERGKHPVARSVATFSQVEIHRPYGGVVPEIASRNHLETLQPMIDRACSDAAISLPEIDVIAVTNRPGLVGALLVGVTGAKSLAYALHKPLVAVHHLEGHCASLFLDRNPKDALPLPMLLAIVSGGHTQLHLMDQPPELWPKDFLRRSLVGRSRDDAAGEAFDKTAKAMGFPYPGGRWIDRTAADGGRADAYAFPRALPQRDILDFSFSGLKTAVALEVNRLKAAEALEAALPNLCASVQEAIVDALWSKIRLAIEKYGCKGLAIVGGVAANSRLRHRLTHEWKGLGLEQAPWMPLPQYCTDNAAMIAAAGGYRYLQGGSLPFAEILTLNAIPNPES